MPKILTLLYPEELTAFRQGEHFPLPQGPGDHFIGVYEVKAPKEHKEPKLIHSIIEESESLECTVCNRTFSSKGRLHQHQMGKCKTGLKTGIKLLTHRKPEKQYPCPLCKHISLSPQAHGGHIAAHRTADQRGKHAKQ